MQTAQLEGLRVGPHPLETAKGRLTELLSAFLVVARGVDELLHEGADPAASEDNIVGLLHYPTRSKKIMEVS